MNARALFHSARLKHGGRAQGRGTSTATFFITLVRTLSIVEINDEQLARYDALVEYLRQHGGTMHDASNATGLPVTYQAPHSPSSIGSRA